MCVAAAAHVRGPPRCGYLLRTLPPAGTEAFADSHDAAVLHCLARLVSGEGNPPVLLSRSAQRAHIRLRMGGLGLHHVLGILG